MENEVHIEEKLNVVDMDDDGIFTNTNDKSITIKNGKRKEGWFNFETELIWFNIVTMVILHVAMIYSLLTFSFTQDWRTTLWIYVMYVISGIGVTGGAHRYWTHRAYKAKWPLRVVLLLSYSAANMNTVYDWVRDHRVHHKYSETDADPHNAKRGFFFAHIGWLMMKKHPEVIKKGSKVDMSDVLMDPVIRYSHRYFWILKIICCYILPTMVPVYLWNETWMRAFISQGIIRHVLLLHAAWSVNSAAHLWGTKPYDKSINPSDNIFVIIASSGEGWHNFHHVFPWDYKAAELGIYKLNYTTFFIDLFSKIGWAYDLKTVSSDLVKTFALNKGDGTHWTSKASELKNKAE